MSMKQAFLCMLLGLTLASAATAALVETSPSGGQTARTTAAPVSARINDPDGYTNVRAAGHIDSYVLARIVVGEIFDAWPSDDDWWKIRLSSGEMGYVQRSRIRVIDGEPTQADQALPPHGFQRISDAVRQFRPDPHFRELSVDDFAMINDDTGEAQVNASQSYFLPSGSRSVVIYFEEGNRGATSASAYVWTGARWTDVTSGVLLSPDGPEGPAEWLRVSRDPASGVRFLNDVTGREMHFLGGRFVEK